MRLSLDESLEAYAKRNGWSVDDARPYWRAEGLSLLRVAAWAPLEMGPARFVLERVSIGLCRIAPGVAVSTNVVTWSDEP